MCEGPRTPPRQRPGGTPCGEGTGVEIELLAFFLWNKMKTLVMPGDGIDAAADDDDGIDVGCEWL